MLLQYLRGFLLACAVGAQAVTTSHDYHARQDDSDSDSDSVQSTFVNPSGSFAFAFSVPEGDTVGYYFSIRMKKSISWGAVGLGSDDMPGALYLMIYQDEDGKNVTFSPRVAYGHYEPYFFDETRWEVLPGTGVEDDHVVFNARCIERCRNWPAGGEPVGGFIDVSSSRQRAIYGIGPEQGFRSDNVEQDIKFHQEFGHFTIDMKRTRGATQAPVLNDDSENEGTELQFRSTGRSDTMSTVHAVLMTISFILLLPLGIVLVRVGKWARYHKYNQAVVAVMVFAGFGLGVNISFNYQRSRGFDTHHQIIGFLVIAFIFGQFSLGFLHHQQHKKTQAPTKWGKYHRWLGRVILFFGILNAFFGFTFALNRKYGQIIAGIILFVALAFMLLLLVRYLLDKKRRDGQAPGQGHPMPPWRQDVPPSGAAGYPNAPPPHYGDAPSGHSGQDPPPSPWRRNSGESRVYDDDPGVDSAPQKTRDFV